MSQYGERALVVATLFFVALIAAHTMLDFDIWFHLRAGSDILRSGAIQHRDIYSETASGREWINHEWLSQVLFAVIYSLGGVAGLILFKVLLITASYGMIFYIARTSTARFLTVLFALCSIILSEKRLLIRPEVFTLFFVALYLLLMMESPKKKGRLVYFFPVLQAVWTNLHGYSLIGIGMVTLFLFDQLFRRLRVVILSVSAGDDVPEGAWLGQLVMVWLATVAAGCIGPYGYHQLLYPLGRIYHAARHTGMVGRHISELKPFYEGHLVHAHYVYKRELLHFLALGAAASFIADIRRMRLDLLFFFLFVFWLSVSMMRHIALFSLVAVMVTGHNLEGYFRQNREVCARRSMRIGSAICIGMSLCILVAGTGWIVGNGYLTDIFSHNKLGLGLSPVTYPEGALTFLLGEKKERVLFNNLSLGGYILWRGYPSFRPFIDGRTELYETDIFPEYIEACSDDEAYGRLLSSYQIDTVLLHHGLEDSLIPLRYLYREGWNLVYLDDTACIFEKPTPTATRQATEGAHRDLSLLDTSAITVKYFGMRKRAFPIGYLSLGRFFTIIKQYDNAIFFYEEAQKIAPGLALIYHELGTLWVLQGDYAVAGAYFQQAIGRDPANPASHYNLARCYLIEGRYNDARDELLKTLRLDGHFAQARDELAALSFRGGGGKENDE